VLGRLNCSKRRRPIWTWLNKRLVFRKVGGKGDKVKSKEANATRTIFLSKRAFEIVCRLADQYPAGVLFRNNGGRKYTISGCCSRFKTLAKKTGVSTSLYQFRHGWAHHNVTVRKTDIVTLAALGGWANVKMLAAIYAHAGANVDHMIAAAG
jgi:integrase